VAKQLFAKTATVFAAESVSQKGNEVNTHTHTVFSTKAAGNGSGSIFQCQWGKD